MATYSEDGVWMWNEESNTWIPSPPSSNNTIETVASTVASNINSNETYCKNCGKLVYKGWKKCTSCGVFVEPLLRETPTTNPFDYQFSNPFQKENDELLDSSIKEKIKKRKKIAGTIFAFMFSITIAAASAGAFAPDCHTNEYWDGDAEWDGGEITNFPTRKSEYVCEEASSSVVGEILFGLGVVLGLMAYGIVPVSLKHWRYCLPDKREIFKGFRKMLIISLILFFLWAILTGWFEEFI